MTTEELKKRKTQLEGLIQKLAYDFSQETGFIPMIQTNASTTDTFCGNATVIKIAVVLA